MNINSNPIEDRILLLQTVEDLSLLSTKLWPDSELLSFIDKDEPFYKVLMNNDPYSLPVVPKESQEILPEIINYLNNLIGSEDIKVYSVFWKKRNVWIFTTQPKEFDPDYFNLYT